MPSRFAFRHAFSRSACLRRRRLTRIADRKTSHVTPATKIAPLTIQTHGGTALYTEVDSENTSVKAVESISDLIAASSLKGCRGSLLVYPRSNVTWIAWSNICRLFESPQASPRPASARIFSGSKCSRANRCLVSKKTCMEGPGAVGKSRIIGLRCKRWEVWTR
jgi:hypothetical protein